MAQQNLHVTIPIDVMAKLEKLKKNTVYNKSQLVALAIKKLKITQLI